MQNTHKTGMWLMLPIKLLISNFLHGYSWIPLPNSEPDQKGAFAHGPMLLHGSVSVYMDQPLF